MNSSAAEAASCLPSSYSDIEELKSIFKSKGLNSKDLAVLSGAHTIGSSHCPSFDKRLYNTTSNGGIDGTLNPKYAAMLRTICKPRDGTTTVDMDPGSVTDFDTHYYKLVENGSGLFHSNAALLQDQVTKDYVHRFRLSQWRFFKAFGNSMVRMGRVGVLTGKYCSSVN